MKRLMAMVVLVGGLAACGDDSATPPQSKDGSVHDVGHDAGNAVNATDGGGLDAALHSDSGTIDSAVSNSHTTDGAVHDAGPADAAVHDAGSLDAALHDGGSSDASAHDAGH